MLLYPPAVCLQKYSTDIKTSRYATQVHYRHKDIKVCDTGIVRHKDIKVYIHRYTTDIKTSRYTYKVYTGTVQI